MADRTLLEVDNALFFTSIGGDRPYTARDFVAYLGAAVGNGIVDLDDLGGQPSGPFYGAVSNLEVTITPGVALLGGSYGYMARQVTSETVEFERPSGDLYRWDRVVLRLDNTSGDRTIKFRIIEGQAGLSPTMPSNATSDLTRNDVTNGGVYELLLFDVYVSGVDIGSPVVVNYDNSPYVLYESKTSKTTTITGKDSDVTSYPNAKGVIDYAVARAGGSSYGMTGDLYMGSHNIYDLETIYAPDLTDLSFVAGVLQTIHFKVGSSDTFYCTANSITFVDTTHFDLGANFNSNVSGYAVKLTTGDLILNENFEFNGEMLTDLDMAGFKLLNGVTSDGNAIGAKSIALFDASVSSSGTMIPKHSDNSSGYTFANLDFPTGMRGLNITFSISARNDNYPYYLSLGMCTSFLSKNALETLSPTISTISGMFLQNEDDFHLHGVQVQRDGDNLKFFNPQYTSGSLSGALEENVWIHSIEAVF